METLSLACFGLATPRKGNNKSPISLYAPEIGLIGVAAELCISAILV